MIDRLIAFLTRHLDPFLATVVGVLLSLGLVVLFSASGESFGRIGNQLVNILIAITVMWVAANVAPQHLLRFAVPVYVVGLVLLICVPLFGDEAKGAKRWLDLGVTRIQPSELMKIGVPLMLAWYFDRYEAILKLKDYVIGSIVLAVPVLLIAAQPDLGTAILVAAAGFYVLFLAGLSWKVLAALGIAAASSLPVLWGMMHTYQRQRVLTLLDPAQDPLGRGYHTIQSTIALGSGGVFGKGWLNGTQSYLDFIPERTTDFIFAVYGEEFGLIGALLLLALYLFIVLRGLYISWHVRDAFARLLSGSLTLTFFIYVFVNIGMVTGLMPVVGVPLPLISYGGTSLVTLMAAFGILMSIHMHRTPSPTQGSP